MMPSSIAATGACVSRARAAAAALLKKLDARFASRNDTLRHNPVLALDSVHDPRHFCLFRTCNAMVVSWLRELGCRVYGIPLDARFAVKPRE